MRKRGKQGIRVGLTGMTLGKVIILEERGKVVKAQCLACGKVFSKRRAWALDGGTQKHCGCIEMSTKYYVEEKLSKKHTAYHLTLENVDFVLRMWHIVVGFANDAEFGPAQPFRVRDVLIFNENLILPRRFAKKLVSEEAKFREWFESRKSIFEEYMYRIENAGELALPESNYYTDEELTKLKEELGWIE